METDVEGLNRLREGVEQKVGRKMAVHGDYEYLSGLIFETLHQQISPTTLKRLWGKLDEPVVPRRSTLDILSQFVGAKSWADFCQRQFVTEEAEEPGQSPSKHKVKARVWAVLLGGLGVALVAVLLWLLYLWGGWRQTDDDRYILRQGQTFDTFADYLHLFGVSDDEEPWYRPVPHYPNLRLWGPQYHHPEWHNNGNPDSLMPTITEYWEPAGSQRIGETEEVVRRMNSNDYHIAQRLNEVRLTFMCNLPADTAHFVFLGVYRLSLSRSDSTHIVWERVAEEVDLRNLDYLERFRN